MEALYFLKFWTPAITNKHHRPSLGIGNSDTTGIAASLLDTECELDEEDDSFFELELTVPDFHNNKCKIIDTNNPLHTDSNLFDSNDQNLCRLANKADNPQPPPVSLSPADHLLSKRRILPIEPSSKPQSPVSLLKSSPRFRVLMFKKSKSMAAHETGETELKGVFVDNPRIKKQESKLFTIKFKLKEVANIPIFTRNNSLRRQIFDDSWKLFSKEVLQKYLKLIKPLYIKVSKKQSKMPKFSGELSPASPSTFPTTLPSGSPKKEKQRSIPAGIRVVCKNLGKSKSASAATTAPPSTVAKRDDSLLLQHDGIESAILHCKNSFNSSSSRDSFLLSSIATDPSHENANASPRISHEY